MGVMEKFLEAMHLDNKELDDYDTDEDYYEDEPAENYKKQLLPRKTHKEEEDEDRSVKKLPQKVTSFHTVKRSSGNGMEVCVIKPTSVEEAREITETLLANQTVVLNMEGLEVEVAQRIIDFASGSTYALKGNLQKISNYIFIITPACVDISGDFQEVVSGSFSVPPMARNVI